MQETILTPREAEALDNHAEQQARAQLRGIRELLAALDLDWMQLEELRDQRADHEADMAEEADPKAWEVAFPDEAEELAELEEAAGDYASEEEAQQALYEDPLEISYRSGWTDDRDNMTPEEFCILLCTGGPAVRIIGEFNWDGQPYCARIEFQDWGTPWTMLFDGQAEALEYAQRLIQL